MHPDVFAIPEGARPRLSPEDRRTAILEATVPLLREHGASVTTRQIADAAGVAEGTLFRVFDDKLAIIVAAIAAALDPEPIVRAIGAVPLDGPLVDVLTAVVDVIEVRGHDLRTVLAVAHELARTHHAELAGCTSVTDPAPGTKAHAAQDLHGRRMQAPEAIIEALTEVLAAHREELRPEPAVCARILLSVATSTLLKPLNPAHQLTSRAIVEVFLDGVRARPTSPETSC